MMDTFEKLSKRQYSMFLNSDTMRNSLGYGTVSSVGKQQPSLYKFVP